MNNLITPINGNNAANKSYVDGIKQAATSLFVPVYVFKLWNGTVYWGGHKFLKSRSKYGISNDLDFTA